MNCDATFKHEVVLTCYDALKDAGFTRYRKEAVDWPLGNGFHCWVGLNSSLRGECVEINPFVGLHVSQIEKFWTDIKTGSYPAKYNRSISTYAIHIGSLAPHELAFRFTRATDVAVDAARLAHLYSTVGKRYAQSIGSYDQLLPLLQERVPTLGGYPERVVACLFLMGHKAEAQTFARDFLVEQPEYFEGFAVPFLAKQVH